METCVLIPQEFSLMAEGPRGQQITVTTNTRVPQGTLCYPFQGTVRLDTINVYDQLDDDDVSTSAPHAQLPSYALHHK